MDKSGNHRDAGAHLKRLIEMDKSALPPDGGERFNRLIFADSPYLLQHAENPVDWYPWGEAAFAKAKAEEKPLFLSIGYATCHWCHVMAHESFENRAVAQVLNRYFVAIKVDREERPDIDEQYMTAAQMMTGSGGWPLNIFMTPDKRPFFAATYLPVEQRMGMPGIVQVLEKLAELWRTDRGKLEETCTNIMAALARQARPSSGDLAEEGIFGEATRQLAAMFDPEWGGFGRAPKFPMPHYISFLLRSWKRNSDPAALTMGEQTLRQMRLGGIFDQLGYGFHRYSVDRQWLVPHFEKMLYDQALISLAYLEAFQATGDRSHLRCTEEIFTYLMREMASPGGGFYSAQDADTEGEEGKYYVWSYAEVVNILGDEDARIFCRLFGVTEKGNFEGVNILHLHVPLEDFAESERVLPELLRADVERWRELLLKAREERIRPLRDEKVLTAWNGLMIAALARGGGAAGNDRWLAAAQRAASFIRDSLVRPDGRLMRSYHLGKATIPAFLDDYAFYVWGLIELYESTLDSGLLKEARRLSDEMLRLFVSTDRGGLFETGSDAEQLQVRARTAYDGVIPSGNSVAAMNLLRLGRILDDQALREAGESLLRGFMGGAARQPVGYLHFLAAYDFLLGPEVEIILVGPADGEETRRMLRAVKGRFIPNLVLRFEEGGGPGTIARVCAMGACRPPARTVAELNRILDEVL